MEKDLTNNLPDLPELESVEASHRAVLFTAAFLTAMVGFILAPSFGYWHTFGRFLPTVVVCTILLFVPVIWVVYRACTDGYYWKTDSEGIVEHSLFRRRKIAWSEVTEVQTSRTLFLSGTHRIYGRTGSISLIADGGFSHMEVLAASAWQHLRRAGKAEGLMLSGEPLSLWDTIPDAALERAELHLRIPEDVYLWPIFYLMWVAIAFMVTSEHRPWWPSIGVATLFGALWLFHFMRKNAPARHYVMTPEYLEILGRPSRRIPWNSLIARSRERAWLGPAVECLYTTEAPINLLIPKGSDPESLRAKLALIRHLREAGRTIMIPNGLRLAAPPPVVMPSDITIRLPRLIIWSMPVMAAFFAVIMALAPRLRPWETGDTVATMVTISMGWAIGFAAWRHSIRVDSDGITKTSAFGMKSIAWKDVTSYKRSAPVPQGSNSLSLEIRGVGKKAIIRLVPDLALTHRWDVLTDYVDSRLAHLLPPIEDQPSWLARPFSAQNHSQSR